MKDIPVCTVCGNPIDADTGYFVIMDALNSNSVLHICEKCGITVTPYQLYMDNRLRMANSADDVIEANAVIVDATPEQVEAFFTSEDPVFTPESHT